MAAANASLRALIIDDERLARNELRRLLSDHPEIEVAGEAANAHEARRAVHDLEPDLLFVDVQMPGESGFDLLASLDSVPLVVFTTAYDEYALRAFDVSALDYLVKPIDPRRLARTVERLLAVGPDRQDGGRSTDERADRGHSPLSAFHRVFVNEASGPGSSSWAASSSSSRKATTRGCSSATRSR